MFVQNISCVILAGAGQIQSEEVSSKDASFRRQGTSTTEKANWKSPINEDGGLC